MKRFGVVIFALLFFTGYLFAQEEPAVAEVDTTTDTAALEATATVADSNAPTVEVAAPGEKAETEDVIRVFEGEKKLKGIKVYENRIYRDDLRGIFGNYIASWVIAGDIKKGLGDKMITNEEVVALMNELRDKGEIESIDFYYTFDAKDRVMIHVTLIDNPGFQDFEGTVKLDRIDFYCRNNFFVSRRALKDAVALDKKGVYTSQELKDAVARINDLYVFNDIVWGLHEEKKSKDGESLYALQIIVSEYGGSKELRTENVTISRIQFLGNWYTQNWVYIRELDFKVGDTVTPEQLDAAAQKLMNLGVCTSVDWGVIYDNEGNTILVFVTKDKLTLLPQFDLAFGSDQLRLGIGFWDKNFLGTKTTINFKFTLKDLMPTFSFSFSVPKISNTYFNYDMGVSYDSTNKYTETRAIKGEAVEKRSKGYREDTVSAYAKGSYSLELADSRQVMWYQSFALKMGYDFIQSQKSGTSQYLGMPDKFATGWLNLAEDFSYDEDYIGFGHYVYFDIDYSFNNYRREGGYRDKGINFSVVDSIGVPAALDGYMAKNLGDGSAIDEKVYNRIETTFTFHAIPVQWFEFKGYVATGYTTTDIVAKQFYFGNRSLVRNIPTNMQGSGKGYYRGNFDVCFTPPIPYVNKVVIIEFDLFADVGNYGHDYTKIWKEIPIWSTGIGFNIYVPFFEGFYLGIDLSWGPNNIREKDGRPLFNFGVSKYY